MISDERRCVFVHIPRCAGTSIEDVIWPGTRHEEDDLWMGFVDELHNKYQTGGLQHLRASQIREEVGDARFSSYFKFSVVRNPFDRLVSQFSHMRSRPELRSFIGMSESSSFAEYLSLIRRRRHVQWEAQSVFLYDDNGELLVDFVGRFENLAEDMAHVFHKIGLDGVELPHVNDSDRQPYREYYTDELRRLVEGMYDRDIVRFGYEF